MYTSSTLKFNEYANGKDAVSYWLQSSTPIIAKEAGGGYLTTSVTFTPMMQVGNGEPREAKEDDDIKIAIWKDQSTAPTSGDRSGAQTIELVSSENENINNNQYNVGSALHCRMFFIKDENHVQVDEQTAEVLAEGVTITKIEYAVGGQGTNENDTDLNWDTEYPETIGQGNYLWTKITYSNGDHSASATYWPNDGSDGLPGTNGSDGSDGKTRGTIILYKASNAEENDKPKAPNKPTATKPNGDGTLDGWQITAPNPSENLRFVWKTNGTYTEDQNETNRTYDTSWTIPELHSAYFANVSGSTAAEYYKLFGTNDNTQGMKFDNGNLYINASMINTGVLTITQNGDEASESNKTLFSAGWDDNGKGSVYINGMTVGEIASKNDVTVGRNLAKKSAVSVFNGSISESEYHYTITKTATNAGLKISDTIFTAGKNYVISYKFTITRGTGIESISGHCSQEITKVVLDGVIQETGSYPNSGFELSNKELGVEHSLVLYMKYTGTGADNNFYIQPERNTNGNIEEFMVWDLKVEEGEVHSPWVVPFEDQLSPNSTGSYSWQFSPTQGIKMWNGAQTDENKVFSIDSQNGLYVKGTITANAGKIGGENGWNITTNSIQKIFTADNIIYEAALQTPELNAPGTAAFKIRYRDASGDHWPFYVRYNGLVHCENLDAVGGKIGGWGLNGTSLTSGSFGKEGGFHMYTSPESYENVFGATGKKDWLLGIGSNFGVTKTGTLYCSDLQVTGGSLVTTGSNSKVEITSGVINLYWGASGEGKQTLRVANYMPTLSENSQDAYQFGLTVDNLYTSGFKTNTLYSPIGPTGILITRGINKLSGKNVRIHFMLALGNSYYLEFNNGILVSIKQGSYQNAAYSGFQYDLSID